MTPTPEPFLPRALLLGVLLLFGALTAAAVWRHGYWGILMPAFQSLGAGQVLADLVIALGLVLVALVRDARARGQAAWPWVLLTLLAGSFGPLLYLLLRRPR